MSISLIKYDEFGRGMGYPSMTAFFQPNEYEGQKEIITYMEKGKVRAVGGRPKDLITGETLPSTNYFMGDGVYSWTSTLIYYVKRYNLKLPDDFIEHVKKQIGEIDHGEK